MGRAGLSSARMMAAGALLGLVCLGAPQDTSASNSGIKKQKAVFLVLMAGTPTVHIIEVPSMERCREAAEFTAKARCVEGKKVEAGADPEKLLEAVPIAAPGRPRDGGPPEVVYKPLN